MGNIGWTGIIIIAVLVVILFGKGKISSIMGDLAKGIKSFKKGMSEIPIQKTKKITTILIVQIPIINNLKCLKLVG